MKVFTFSLLATAMTAALVRADTCNTASVTALLTSSEVTTCASDSGYSPSSLKTPTSAEIKIMCSNTACQEVLSDLRTMFPEECTVDVFALYADLITPVTLECSGSSSSSTAASAESNASTSESTAASATSASASTGAVPSTSSASASTGAVPSTSSASLDSVEEVTMAPTTNTTSSASSDDDVTVGDSDSGSDFIIETQAPSSGSASTTAPSTTADSAASASSAVDSTSSGSSAGVAMSPSVTLLGPALLATAALFL